MWSIGAQSLPSHRFTGYSKYDTASNGLKWVKICPTIHNLHHPTTPHWALHNQVDILWVVTPCNITVRY